MSGSIGNEELQRDALAEIDRLLDKSRAERAEALHELAHSRPDLHALVLDLLKHEETVGNGFMEPGTTGSGEGALRPDSRLGPYRIIRLLGEGGMGEVWLARRDDGLYEGEVAIKTLHPYFAGGALRERFLREAKVLGCLAHTNIARLLDAGIHEGVVYLVLEYVVGRPIDVACDEEKLDIPSRLRIFGQLCDAVAHAHSSLVVHRDIKPGNVLLTPERVPKLLDFGIASFYEPEKGGPASDITRLTGRIFTPEYAAPEQVLGQEITTATDVYSLGVLLHVLLTGQLPYQPSDGGRTKWEHAVLHQEPQGMVRALEQRDDVAAKRSMPLAKLRRELAGDLENIVQKALKKRPEERYATVAALAEDIRHYLRGEPVLARADSAWYRLGKFAQRNRLAVGSAVAVVLALGIGLAASLWQLQVARVERARAEESKDFIASIFRSADPFYTGKDSMTAVDMLDLARQRIDSELDSQPENAVELLTLVGESQLNLGQHDKAWETTAKAVEMAEHLQPRDEVLIAEARGRLAVIAGEKGEMEQARALAAQALPDLRKYQPRTGRTLKEVLIALAYVESDENSDTRAISLAEEGVAAVTAALGPAHSETISSRAHLANFLQDAKRFEEARLVAEQALQDAKAKTSSGESGALLIQTEGLLGSVLLSMGQPQEAISHLGAATELAAKLYGPNNASRYTWYSELARAQSRVGDYKGLLVTRRLAFEGREPGLVQARALTNYGRSALEAAQVPEALRLLEQAIEQEKQYDTGKGSWLLIAQSSYGSALALSGRFAEADRTLQAAIPLVREGSNDGRALAWNPVGLAHLLQSRWRESEAAYRKALGTEETRPNPMMRAEALLGIGITQLERGQAADAEGSMRQAQEAAAEMYLGMTPLRADIAMNLGRALLARGKIDEANQSFAAANAYWLEYDATNRNAGLAAYWLARGRLAGGEEDEARAGFLRAAEILKKSPLPADARQARDARSLVAKL